MSIAPFAKKKIFNARLNRKEFFQGRTILLSYPLHVQIGTNLTCNLKCIFCRRNLPKEAQRLDNLKPNEREMSFNVIDQVKDLMPYAEIFNITPFGEPFMYSHIQDLLQEHKKFGSNNLAITTNCTLFNEKNAKMVVENRVNTIYLSIDAADPNIYESMRVPAKFSKVEEGLNIVNFYKKKMNSKYPKLVLASTFMLRNVSQMPHMVDFAKNYGIEEISIQLMEINNPDLAQEDLSNHVHDLRENLHLTKAKASALSIELHLNMAIQNLLYADERPKAGKHKSHKDGESHGKPLIEKCTMPFYFVYIDTNGDVRPCCWAAIRLGNLNQNTFQEIWNGEVAQETRRAFYANYIPDGCRNQHCKVDL